MPKRRCRPRVIAIYAITCLPNKKTYIGSSLDVSSRWGAHIVAFLTYTHINKAMLADWKKYGIKAFSFSLVYVFYTKPTPTLLRKKEQEEMDKITPALLYNSRRAVKKENK